MDVKNQTNQKYFYFLVVMFLVFISSFVQSQERKISETGINQKSIQGKLKTAVAKETGPSYGSRSRRLERDLPEVVVDSFVVKTKDSEAKNIGKKLGAYYFELEPGVLKNTYEHKSEANEKKLGGELKLVHFERNNKYMLTDGIVILFFEDGVDEISVANEYDLVFRAKLSKSTVYEPVPTENINSLLKQLKNDPRVAEVELNLIDPHVRAQ